MPWHIVPNSAKCPVAKPWAVIKDSDGTLAGCHASKQNAKKQMAALYANVKSEGTAMIDRTALRAEAAKLRAGTLGTALRTSLPCGDRQRNDVKLASEFRSSTVERDGREFYVLEGYASTTEQPYEMWDTFGPYNEIVSKSAFDKTLAADPLVVFRFNHAGTPMASTRNGRLELSVDNVGFKDLAYLNPQRDDVQLLMHAVRDGDVTEQSFMFQIDDGTWSEDFAEFRINEVSLDRGDVGPVSYGANPTTSVAARSGELLAAIPDLPPLVAREAYSLLTQQFARQPEREVITIQRTPEPPAPEEAHGMSLRLRLAQLEVDKQTS